jgi:hypothetical protein
MTLRILFTLAILAGLAAAPSAQTPGPQRGNRAGVETFRWQAGSRDDAGSRVERALEQARRNVARQWDRIERSVQRAITQRERAENRRADRIAAQVRASVRQQVQARVRSEVRLNRAIVRGYWGPNWGSNGDFNLTQSGTDADPCSGNNNSWDDNYRQHCEVRESTMPGGALTVDAGQNGGISVDAWDRNDVRVRAIVRTKARSDERARQLASGVQIQSGGGRVLATGPDTERRENWSVSYRINVPRRTDLDLSANNGGITINGVSGNVRFDTTNGGVRLGGLGGRVNGRTTNGGLTVNLSGDRWDGEGIDVETSNGGVTLSIPDNYNAQLEARTINGGLNIDFPITIQGELSSRRGITTTLGSGGPTVRVRTNNGGLRIGRR